MSKYGLILLRSIRKFSRLKLSVKYPGIQAVDVDSMDGYPGDLRKSNKEKYIQNIYNYKKRYFLLILLAVANTPF